MDWWPTLLSNLGSIVIGLVIAAFLIYIISRVLNKPFFKKRATPAAREQFKPTSLAPREELDKQAREQVAKQIEEEITAAVGERLKPSAPQPGIKLGNGLIPLNLLVVILILATIFFPSNVLRIILGIPLLLFFPGYSLLVALFPKKEGLGGIERVALSFILSIAVVPLVGLILNYTPWGIRLEPILYSVASFVFITSIIAWLRHRRLFESERFAIKFQMTIPSWGKGAWERVLTITLVVAILGALGMLGYILATPKEKEAFTEFYILGQGGKAVDYPIDLKLGAESKVTVVIVNHEGKQVSYRVEVVIGSKKSGEAGPVVLVNEQKWEGKVGFVTEMLGENQKIELLLYKSGEVEPYLGPLYLWVNVGE